jgi:hypothetical protein
MCAQRRIQTRSAHDRHGPTDWLGRAGAESYTAADGRARSNGRARRADCAPIHGSSNPPGPNPPNTSLLLRLTTAPGTPATQGPQSTSCGPADHPGPPATPPDGPSGHRAWPRPAVSPPGNDGGRRSRTALTNMSGGADGCVRCGRWTRAQRGRPLFHLAGPASPCRFALRWRARPAPPRPAPLRCHPGARH